MKVLYVTTFNQELYDLTGKNLISTFLNKTKESDELDKVDLFVVYEDMIFENESSRILTFDISNSKYFNNWIKENAKNIPKFFGGEAENNDERFLLDKKKGQPWARFRASRYFRKIAALNIALDTFKNTYDLIFLIDSDCVFKKNIDAKIIKEIFDNNVSMIYFWGKHRRKINRGPETGFTGYMKKNNGFEIAKKICDCFTSGKFLNYEYWDDGYVIGKLIDELKNTYVLKDMVEGSNKRTTRVMEINYNKLFDYIHHFKNKHKFNF